MKNAIGSAFRRLFASAPGVVVLVVALGVGVAYSATNGDTTANSDTTTSSDQSGGGEPHGGAVRAFRAPDLTDEQKQQLEAFRQCMSDQGVDLPDPPKPGARPDPSKRPDMPDPEKLRKAHDACADKLPDDLPAPPPGCGPGGPPGAKHGKGARFEMPAPPPGPPPAGGSESGQSDSQSNG